MEYNPKCTAQRSAWAMDTKSNQKSSDLEPLNL